MHQGSGQPGHKVQLPPGGQLLRQPVVVDATQPHVGQGAVRTPFDDAKVRVAASEQELPAELILECILADGVDLASLGPTQRALGFRLEGGRFTQTLGRVHQLEFFEKLVPKLDQYTCISRAHCEVTWQAPAVTLTLRQLSPAAFLIDDVPLGENQCVTLDSGTRLGFKPMQEGTPPFLVLRVLLRDRATVAARGSHPSVVGGRGSLVGGGPAPVQAPVTPSHAAAPAPAPAPAPPPAPATPSVEKSPFRASAVSVPPPCLDILPAETKPSNVEVPKSYRPMVTVLECTHASGIDVSRLPMSERSVQLRKDQSLDIGRQHQLGFFENLLQAETNWLSFISRSHCRVILTEKAPDATEENPSGLNLLLEVENVSLNVTFVGDQPLPRGSGSSIRVGGKLEFAAAPQGRDVTKFLIFVLRRVTEV